MITISVPTVRQVVFECLEEANRRIVAAELTHATTFRFWIDARFGNCGVELNGDDDEDFRCPGGETFTIGGVFARSIDEIGDMDDRFSVESEIWLEDPMPEQCQKFSNYDAYCEHFGKLAIMWLREWSDSAARGDWSPCWFEALETNAVATSDEAFEIWRVETRPLPAFVEAPSATRFIGLNGGDGLKVYVIDGGARGYATGHLESKFRLAGDAPTGTWPSPLPITIWSDWQRLGGLVNFGRTGFALRSDHPAVDEARAFFGSVVEWLPASDGKNEWLIANALDPVEALDLKLTKFSHYGESSGIDVAEFDADLLRGLDRPLFKVIGDHHRRLYFLERPGEESFPAFCERVGLLGVRWHLVWCEDTSEIERMLATFVEEIEARVRRREGRGFVGNPADCEGIYGGQRDILRIALFRDIVRQRGVPDAIREIRGLGSLGIPSVREICGQDWYGSNLPERPGIETVLAESFARRDPLLEIRGYLCTYLPGAVKSLREMERDGTGQLAAYGPTV
ncbi:MAG: hypothetical protein V4819_07110 [Verrucomicrobiota bacterium]